MIQPALRDQGFLDDVLDARFDREQLHLWWLGQSGFLIHWQRRFLLFDPYLSETLTRKYASTDKPHTRMTAPVVDPHRLDFVDVTTSSHNHTDHLDPGTLGPMLEANPSMQLVVPEANREFVADRLRIGSEVPLGLDAGQFVEVSGFVVHALPAAHESIERDAAGRHTCLGYVVQAGPWTLYHSGDTVRYDGMVDWLRRQPVDLAMLPINGRRPERRVAGNLWGREAAALAHEIGARMVFPCHFEMFEFNTETPDEFVATARTLGQAHCVLRAGERWSTSRL